MDLRDHSMHPARSRDKVLLMGVLAVAAIGAVLLLWRRGGEPIPPELVPVAPVARVSKVEDEVAPRLARDVAPDRAVLEMPPLEEAASALPDQDSSAENSFEGPGATEALRALRLSELERNWQQVAAARERNHEGDVTSVGALLMAGMKPILDEAGFGEKQVGTRSEYPPDQHYLFINGTDYFVPHGQFPVVDRYFQLWKDWSHQPGRSPKRPFVLDEPFLVSLEAMKIRAAEAIGRRTEMY